MGFESQVHVVRTFEIRSDIQCHFPPNDHEIAGHIPVNNTKVTDLPHHIEIQDLTEVFR
jgi:hypothetical protein